MIKTYECEKCGRFDQFMNVGEGELKECPSCGKPVKRIFKPLMGDAIWKTDGAFGKSGR